MTDSRSKMVEGGRRWSKAAAALLVAWCMAPSLGQTQSLEKRLDALLDAPPFNRHLWGIALQDPEGKTLYARNADKLFIPASNAKLVVTAAASVLLPPDLTVRTSLYATGPVANGVLQGHLVLYGRGDPSMSRRCYEVDTTRAGACEPDPFHPLRELARAIKQAGVSTIAGDLVGDGSWFDATLLHPGWENYDLAWWYAAPVSGLGFTDNSIEVLPVPTSAGAPAALTLWPDLGDLVLENRTRTVAEGGRRTLDIIREPGTGRLIATGDVPLGSRPRSEYVAVTDPSLYTAMALRRVLAEEGVAVLGGTRSTTDSMLFRTARLEPPLAEVDSRPLRDWLFPVLNTSQNWFAEMLLKQLGRQFGGVGSWDSGLAVARRFLIDSVRVDSTQISLSDGSGLSSTNLISPLSLVTILTWMRRHPRYATFAAGLPRSAQPGSLRTRFVGTPLEGQVLAKTGSISTVNTLSGYLERPDGKTLIFSIQANHHMLGGRAMIAAIDSLVVVMGR